MDQIQLYINDQLVDLSDDNPIALTFQINNLAEVKNQQGNTSNQFKLPLTARNRQILGFPDEVAFTNNMPYDYYSARVIQDGLEIVPYGIAQLNTIEQDSASITVLSGNVDFFDALEGKIYDMGDSTTPYGVNKPFDTYQHKWNVDSVVKSQVKTDGWIWPVVDYGNLIYNPVGDNEINVRYLRPGFFIKTAIDIMLAANGYKGTGSLLNNPLYPLLIAQFSNDSFEHSTDYQTQPDALGVLAYTNTDQSALHTSVADPYGKGIFKFGRVDTDPKEQFNGTTFTSSQIFTGEILLTVPKFYFKGRKNDDHPSFLNIYIYLQTPDGDLKVSATTYDLSEWNRIQGTSGKGLQGDNTFDSRKLSGEVNFIPGYQLTIRWEFFGDEPESFIMYSGASLSIKAANDAVLFGQDVQCERIFPDISQKDLLKDTLQRFGIVCQTDNTTRTINFASFKDIVANMPVAKNWTSKCLDQGKTITFQLGGYAQVNYLKYKADENVLPLGFADSQINVADKTLAAAADLFESQFAPTTNRPYIDGTIAQITMIDATSDSDEFSIGVTPRILIDQKLPLNGRNIKFTDGDSANDRIVNDAISVPYFYKPDGKYNLCFGDMPGKAQTLPGLKTSYYPELERILKQTKKVLRYFLLSPLDILELDLLVPIYLEQDGCYYYINKIDSWRKGQPTKVELVKLG